MKKISEMSSKFENIPKYKIMRNQELMNELMAQQKYDEALTLIDQTLPILRQTRDHFRVAMFHERRAATLYLQKRYTAVLEEIGKTKGLPIPHPVIKSRLDFQLARAQAQLGDRSALNFEPKQATESLSQLEISDRYRLVAQQIYAPLGEYKLAYEAVLTSFDIWQKSATDSNNRRAIELQEQFNLKQKDLENAALRAKSESQARDIRLAIAAAATMGVALLTIGWLLYRQARSRRQLATLSANLEATNAELQRIHALRTRMIAAACHDLRGPTHTIGLLAELARTAADRGDAARHLQTLEHSSETLSDMMATLLDLTQLEEARYQPTLRRFPVAVLLEDVRMQFAKAAADKRLSLVIEPTDALVVSDTHLLRRSLFNLVSNAIKYTAQGGVTVGAMVDGGALRLRVQDTGPGFERGRVARGWTTNTEFDFDQSHHGLGIGLTIVEKSCELLGHQFELNSAPGAGTCATIHLLSDAVDSASLAVAAAGAEAGSSAGADSATPAATRPAENAQATLRGEGRRIVLLENDSYLAEATRELLQNWGFEVDAGQAENELIELLRRDPSREPSLIISDLHLNDADGFSSIRRIREEFNWSRMAGVILTGDLSERAEQRAREERLVLLHKPLTPSRLAMHLASVLGASAPAVA